MSTLNPIFVLDMGEDIQPFGSFPEPLPLGAFPFRLIEAGLGQSRKAGSTNVGLRVIVEIIDPAVVGDRNCSGFRVEKMFNLPQPKAGTNNQYEFGKEPNTQGYRNSMSVAAIKAFLVCVGEPLENVVKMKNSIQIDMSKYIGRQGVLYNEPAPANSQDVYSEQHWLDPQNGANALAGTFIPQLKKSRAKATPSNVTNYNIPSGGGSLNQGLPSGAALFAPGTNGPNVAGFGDANAFDDFDSRLS